MSDRGEIKITHPDALEVEIASGAMTRLAGVSESLAGSTGIHLAIATVPPGRCSMTHYHTNCESAIYVERGNGLFLTGADLEVSNPISAGDFIYVPAGAPHQPVNTTDDEDLVLIVARNTAVEIVVDMPSAGRQDC
ncbi:MAG: cupin domain-containing protein [Chloroflexi bacterium]|nr:cupin domain-containing protein [Chloroflexota bacterium]